MMFVEKFERMTPSNANYFHHAKSEEIDKVLGLEIGADDFIEKPFWSQRGSGPYPSSNSKSRHSQKNRN